MKKQKIINLIVLLTPISGKINPLVIQKNKLNKEKLSLGGGNRFIKTIKYQNIISDSIGVFIKSSM